LRRARDHDGDFGLFPAGLQSLVAHTLNGAPVLIGNGAPLRLRIERKLGYKQPRCLAAIELTYGFGHIAGGSGGYWEDRDYDWYVAI